MAAFSSYHHPPFLVDSISLTKTQSPNIQNLNQEGSSVDTSALESSCIEQQSANYYDELCLNEKHSTESFASMDESGEQVTQNYNKRKNRNGCSPNSANSKDVKQVNCKKPKTEKEIMKDVRNDKKDQINQTTQEPPKGYIHVRARRGQATDSHSLAERVRREKISERMKTLQAIVPGCDKVTGKALMLDEIINYVQSLQNQVEFLSMKLASLDPMLYTFGLMDLDSLPFGIHEVMNNNMTLSLAPLVPSTTTSTTGGNATFSETNAVANSTTATTSTAFPCPFVDSSTSSLHCQEQRQVLPTHVQEGRSAYWPWGVLDEEQSQNQSNIINQFGLGGNINNFYSFHS